MMMMALKGDENNGSAVNNNATEQNSTTQETTRDSDAAVEEEVAIEEDPFDVFGDDDYDDDDQSSSSSSLSADPGRSPNLTTKPITSTRRDPSCGVLVFHAGTEMALLQHVQRETAKTAKMMMTMATAATNNDDNGTIDNTENRIQRADVVLASIDRFCWQRHWMMHIGPQKGVHIAGLVQECLLKKYKFGGAAVDVEGKDGRQPVFTCVELGTYCGYSSIFLARTMLCHQTVEETQAKEQQQRKQQVSPWFRIYTVEVVEEHARVAQEMIRLAGMEAWIEVLVLHPTVQSLSELLIGQLSSSSEMYPATTIDFLFLDHDKSRYVADLKQLESSNMIQKGCHVAADNVIFAAIDDYRLYMHDHQSQNIVQTSLVEGDLEYSTPEWDAFDKKLNVEQRLEKQHQLRDGIEFSVYLQDPPMKTKTTMIVLPILPSRRHDEERTNTAAKASKNIHRANTQSRPRDNGRSARSGSIVSVQAKTPIRSSVPVGLFPLLAGLLLVLYTPSWLLLVHYDNNAADDKNTYCHHQYVRAILETLKVIILEVIPVISSTMLSMFLAGLFLFMAWSEWTTGSSRKQGSKTGRRSSSASTPAPTSKKND